MQELYLGDLNMAARKSAKNTQTKVETADTVESRVVALAEQLGWFLGTVRGKADGLLANDTVRQEVARIRDGAAELLEHVNRAGASAKVAAADAASTAIDAAASVGTSARKVAASAGSSAKQAVVSASTTAKKAVATASKAAQKAVKGAPVAEPALAAPKKRSGGTVDAPGKRHRKPPPQEKVGKRMGEPAGKKMGQKQFQPGKTARRG